MKYKDKLYHQLRETLRTYLVIIMQLGDIEDKSGLSEKEFDERIINGDYINEKHEHLQEQATQLKKDLAKIMVDAKSLIMQDLPGKFKGLIKDIEKILSEDIKLAGREHLQFYFDFNKDDIEKRLKDIHLLCLENTYPHARIYELYGEAINCYIWGSFNASAILCRAIVEMIAVTRISFGKYKYLLSGKNKDHKIYSLINILEKELKDSISDSEMVEDLLRLYKRICSKADSILHNKDEKASEKDALTSIKYLQKFIIKFPPIKVL